MTFYLTKNFLFTNVKKNIGQNVFNVQDNARITLLEGCHAPEQSPKDDRKHNGSFNLSVKYFFNYCKLFLFVYEFSHESLGVANTFRHKPVLKYLWYLYFRLLTTLLRKLVAENQFVSGTLRNKVVANKFKISDDLR